MPRPRLPEQQSEKKKLLNARVYGQRRTKTMLPQTMLNASTS